MVTGDLSELSVQTVRAIRDGSRRVIHPRTGRLAMRAQGQCRTAVETLVLIKGGVRTVFTRQANFAAGRSR